MGTSPDDQESTTADVEHDERPTARVRAARAGDAAGAAATRTPPSRNRRAPVRRAHVEVVEAAAAPDVPADGSGDEVFDWDSDADSGPGVAVEPVASAPEVAALLRDVTRSGAAAAAPEVAEATTAVSASPEQHEDHFWQAEPTRKAGKRQARVQPRERRYRQTVQRVDLWSVAKLSLCFYISCMFVVLIALVALWMVADAAGIVHSVEKFIGDLLSSKDFHFLSGQVLRGAALIAVVVVALQVVVTVIAASFYNIFSELFGGLEITIKEEESTPPV